MKKQKFLIIKYLDWMHFKDHWWHILDKKTGKLLISLIKWNQKIHNGNYEIYVFGKRDFSDYELYSTLEETKSRIEKVLDAPDFDWSLINKEMGIE